MSELEIHLLIDGLRSVGRRDLSNRVQRAWDAHEKREPGAAVRLARVAAEAQELYDRHDARKSGYWSYWS